MLAQIGLGLGGNHVFGYLDQRESGIVNFP